MLLLEEMFGNSILRFHRQSLECFPFSYFIVPKKYTGSVGSEETHMNGEGGKFIFACNGWVMGDDPLRNFAEEGT